MNDMISLEEWNKALKTAKELAENGDVEGMKAAGALIRYGHTGEENNIEEALVYYKMAAEHGDSESSYRVGSYLVEKDDPAALKYMKQAADRGYEKAILYVGLAYVYEWDCQKDDIIAEKYLRLASLQGNAEAQWELFKLLHNYRINNKISEPVMRLSLTNHSAHWLACSYLSGYEEAVDMVRERGLDGGKGLEALEFFLDDARENGPNPDLYGRNILSRTTSMGNHQEKYVEKSHQEYKQNNKKNGCYIATAVYGSYDCPEVWVLRRYRDRVLRETWYGNLFVHVYYAISPTIVKYFSKNMVFKHFVRKRLDKMVSNLKMHGMKDSPYQD